MVNFFKSDSEREGLILTSTSCSIVTCYLPFAISQKSGVLENRIWRHHDSSARVQPVGLQFYQQILKVRHEFLIVFYRNLLSISKHQPRNNANLQMELVGGGVIYPGHVTASWWDRSAIPTTTSAPFLTTAIPMELTGILPDVSGILENPRWRPINWY